MLRSPHSRAHVTVASSARSRPSIGPPSQHDPRRCCQVHRHRQHLCRIPPPPILVVAGNETTDDTMRFVRHNAPRPPRGATDGAYALGSALSTRRIDGRRHRRLRLCRRPRRCFSRPPDTPCSIPLPLHCRSDNIFPCIDEGMEGMMKIYVVCVARRCRRAKIVVGDVERDRIVRHDPDDRVDINVQYDRSPSSWNNDVIVAPHGWLSCRLAQALRRTLAPTTTHQRLRHLPRAPPSLMTIHSPPMDSQGCGPKGKPILLTRLRLADQIGQHPRQGVRRLQMILVRYRSKNSCAMGIFPSSRRSIWKK